MSIYQIKPMADIDGHIEPVSPRAAQFWGIYIRLVDGTHQHIVDFDTFDAAIAEYDRLNKAFSEDVAVLAAEFMSLVDLDRFHKNEDFHGGSIELDYYIAESAFAFSHFHTVGEFFYEGDDYWNDDDQHGRIASWYELCDYWFAEKMSKDIHGEVA